MTRRVFVLLVSIGALSCGVGFGQEEDIYSPKLRIAWDEFKTLYDAKKAVVVDVRDEGSYQNGHIPGARSIPLDDIETRASELKKLKKPIVTYCA